MLLTLFNKLALSAQVTVINQCPYAVSCAVVDATKISKRLALRDGPVFTPVDSAGITIDAKPNLGQTVMCGKPAELPNTVTQLEWQLDDKFWYDVSLVNGNPFRADGFQVKSSYQQPPTDTPWPRCWDVWCAQDADCPTNQAYTTPTDDRNKEDNPMRDCPTDSHITWYICLTDAQKSETRVLGPPEN